MKVSHCLLSSASLIFLATPALAEADTGALFHSGWSSMGFVLGYGDRDAYVDYSCHGEDPGVGKECDGPPEIGLVRKFTSIIDDVVTALEIEKCTDVPTSGTKDVTLDATVTYNTPTQTIPTGWTGGGEAFDRRLEFDTEISGHTTKFVMEASCSHEKTVMAAMNMVVGDNAPGYERRINVWLGQKDGMTVGDVYVAEVNSDGDVRGAYGFGLSIAEESKIYKIWGAAGVHYDNNTSDQATDVYNLTGNFADHTLSLRVKRFVSEGLTSGNMSYYDVAALEAIDGSNVADLPVTTKYDLLVSKADVAAGGSATAQGCMDFDAPATAPTSADACSGMDWSAAPTPVIDASGKFSAAWVVGSMHAKLKAIPTL